jgi:hypothetical protein
MNASLLATDGACGLLFSAAKLSGAFPPDMPAELRARVSRLGGFTRSLSGLLFPPAGAPVYSWNLKSNYTSESPQPSKF